MKENQSTGKALEIKKKLVNNNNKIVIKTNNTGNQPTIIKTFLLVHFEQGRILHWKCHLFFLKLK